VLELRNALLLLLVLLREYACHSNSVFPGDTKAYLSGPVSSTKGNIEERESETEELCVCAYVYIYVYIYVCIYICVCVYINVYIYMYIYMCVYICVYIYVCIYVCIYMCVYIYILGPGIA